MTVYVEDWGYWLNDADVIFDPLGAELARIRRGGLLPTADPLLIIV